MKTNQISRLLGRTPLSLTEHQAYYAEAHSFHPLSWMEYINLSYFCMYFLFNITPLQRYIEISWTRKFFFFFFFGNSTTLPFLKEQHRHLSLNTFTHWVTLIWAKSSYINVHTHPHHFLAEIECILVVVHRWASTPRKYSLIFFWRPTPDSQWNPDLSYIVIFIVK